MRQKNRQVTDFSEIVEIIKASDICRIAINDEIYPYILPLNFGFDVCDDKLILYFHSALEGTKVNLLKKNNCVSFEMDTDHALGADESRGYCTFYYSSVIGNGEIFFIDDEDEKVHALQAIMNKYHMEDFKWSHAAIPRTLVYKLIVKNVTGKRKAKK